MSTVRRDTKKKGKAKVVRTNRGLLVGAAAFLAVGIAALGAIFIGNSGAPSSEGGQAGNFPVQVGDPGPGEEAPPMQLQDTEGETFDLSQKRGETVLLYFHEGLGCQPCWDQIRDMEANSGEFEKLGIDETISITNNPPDAMEQKVADEGISTPVLSDPYLTVSKAYGTNKYGMMGDGTNGHSFIVVGPDGEVKWRADYGGPPGYTMYVPVPDLLADMREGLEGKGGS